MDRKLIASTQPYEVRYFARKWGLTAAEARAIIKEYGPSRKACNEAGKALQDEHDDAAFLQIAEDMHNLKVAGGLVKP